MQTFSDESIGRATAELGFLAEQAGMGLAGWGDFTLALANVVPGCFSIFMQNDNLTPAHGVFSYAGFEVEHMKLYMEYYAPINPWNEFWSGVEVGKVVRSSEVMPAASFLNTEFYNDWIQPLGKRDDGIGVKLRVTPDTPIILSMQVPDRNRAEAEKILTPIIKQIKGTLVRSIATSYLTSERESKIAAAAVVVGREPQIAFAVDRRLHVIEANAFGVAALSAGDIVSSRGNTVRIGSDSAQKWLERTLSAIACGMPPDDYRHVFLHGGQPYRISVMRVPEFGHTQRSFMALRYLFLVVIRNAAVGRKPVDGETLHRLYGLTPAETRLCQALLLNLSLAECAERLSLTRETVRDRIKKIFQKTGTNRQASLIALLAGLA